MLQLMRESSYTYLPLSIAMQVLDHLPPSTSVRTLGETRMAITCVNLFLIAYLYYMLSSVGSISIVIYPRPLATPLT